MKLNPSKVALTVGAFAGVVHILWGLMVATNLATPYLDFVFGLHFVNNPLTTQPFDVVKWITLVVVASVCGYVFGYVFSWLWNRMHS